MQNASLPNPSKKDYYFSSYESLAVADISLAKVLGKAYAKSLSQSVDTSSVESKDNIFDRNNFLSDVFSKEYMEVIENNFRMHLEPLASPDDENKAHQITPAVIQTKKTSSAVDVWAAPIQSFEGRVINVVENEAMDVILVDKTGGMPDHELRIELQWVSEQDRDLIKRGAVFYLSLYKERSQGGSIRNSQEIRFRRLPNWSQTSIDKIKSKAEELLASRFQTAPLDTK